MNKSDLSPIKERARKEVQKNFSGRENPEFIIGVSGGPDSMCLLYIFKQLGLNGLVVHVNYGKRGEASDRDAELVEQMSFQWGFDCQTISADPGEAEGENFQQWAREVRYSAFRDLARETGADAIAVAHNQDDQIETILQKQFRGAGLASWTGMQVWDGEIFRPLLHTSRKEIEKYIEQEHIPFRIDRSNEESDFARNFLRNEWLMRLDEHFPGWKHNVLRMAEQASLFEEAVNWISRQITEGDGKLRRQALLEINPLLRNALVIHELKRIRPGVQISAGALTELDKLADLQTGKDLKVTEYFSILRDREYFRILHNYSEDVRPVKLTRDQLAKVPFKTDGITIELTEFSEPDYSRNLFLDADRIAWPLKLRQWRAGDQFRPFGMKGHQKVSDHLTNRKVSAAEKKRAMVLESFEEIICAVIFPPTEKRVPPGTISEHVRCGNTTRRTLTIKSSA